ncbi:YicC/YloC family endoribonuclease [Castellaniella sp.]|uniref:YicC/YloC family endoribonuclease n=1 Tax=Castellaniella sp. TaxID=1955812 RepID=UPI003564815A
MIRSMTAFGNAQAKAGQTTLSVEIRSVNNRFLDVSLRLPEDLRFAETRVRELIAEHVLRGKIELRMQLDTDDDAARQPIDLQALQALAEQLAQAREVMPEIQPPAFHELPRMPGSLRGEQPEALLALCEQACTNALRQLAEHREREGARLANAMLQLAAQMQALIADVETHMPTLVQQHQEKIAQRLRDALMQACPEGLGQIGGPELSARITQEASLFSLRSDVAEELTRLASHVQELHELLGDLIPASGRRHGSGHGKRLDFLFQEMNREANTLGSKAASISVTQAAIDLKLLIEQMREQAQNIE